MKNLAGKNGLTWYNFFSGIASSVLLREAPFSTALERLVESLFIDDCCRSDIGFCRSA